MKLIKAMTAVFFIALTLCLPAHAEHLPEEDLIGSTVIVERDRNIVEDNIKGNLGFDPEDYTATLMTKTRFFIRCTLPTLLIALSGALPLILINGKIHLSKRAKKKQ